MAKKQGGGILSFIFSTAMLLAIVLMIIGNMIDTATNASAPWVVALGSATTALSSATGWFGILIVAGFGGMAYALISKTFNK